MGQYDSNRTSNDRKKAKGRRARRAPSSKRREELMDDTQDHYLWRVRALREQEGGENDWVMNAGDRYRERLRDVSCSGNRTEVGDCFAEK